MPIDMIEHEKKVDSFLAQLKATLMTPDHGDGASWPDVSDAALSDMHAQVSAALELKWGVDCDGDAPIRIRMWQRRLYRMPAEHCYLGLGKENETLMAEEARLSANICSISNGMSSLASELNQAQFALELNRLQRLAEAAAFPVFLVRYEKTEAWSAAHKYDSPASIHLTEADADAVIASAPLTMLSKKQRMVVPSTKYAPANDFAEFKARMAEVVGQVLPYQGKLAEFVASRHR